MYNNVSEDFAAAIEWANAQEDYASPFDMEGFFESYYADAEAKYDEGLAFKRRAPTRTTWATGWGLSR